MADVKYIITVDAAGATKSIETFDQAVKNMGGATEKATGSFGSLWKQFAIGQIAVEALRKGWGLLKDQIGGSMKEAIEGERVERALGATLELTGRGAAQLADHFKKYSAELQRSTIYGDEAIMSTQTLLLQLTNLDRKGIDAATRGAIGLASTLGMDLNSAASLVAKAMAGNVSVLSRYGIIVDQTLTKEQQRASLLGKLEVLYGRATAETQTFSGKLGQLKETWSDVQQAAGQFILQQKGVITIVEKASQSILDYLTMNVRLQEAQRSAEEQENRRTMWLGKAAAAANWQYREMANLIESYGGVTPALLAAINAEKYGIEIKNAYRDVIQKERAAWLALEAARKKAETGTPMAATAAAVKLLNTEIEAMPWGRHRAEMELVAKQLFETTTVIEGQLPAVDKLSKHYRLLEAELARINKIPPTWVEKWSAAMEKVKEVTDVAFAGMNQIFSQAQTNREIAIENEYKKRLAFINANVTDETAKQQAIIALEAEYEIKRSSARRAAAKQAKAVALMEAIVNTASAVAEALPNVFLAAVAAAMGAVQIGVIKAQPIPLAKGFEGIVRKPTTFLAGEAGPEYLSVRPARAVAGVGGVGGQTIYIYGPLLSVRELSDSNIRAAGDKLYAEIKHQAKRLGRG